MKTSWISHIFLSAILILPLCSCTDRIIRGSENVVAEIRQVEGIHEVRLGGIGELILIQGEAESLTIQAEENLLPYIETEVQQGVLSIGIQDELEQGVIFQPTMPIQFILEVTEVDTLVVSGSMVLRADRLIAPSLTLECSGNSKAEIGSLTTDRLVITLSGSASIEVSGIAPSQHVEISGNGQYNAGNLQSNAVTLNTSGNANAVVWAEDQLTLDLSGAGSVSYYGNPILSGNDTGVVDVVGLGDK